LDSSPFQKLIEAVMAKDIDAALATFADDAVLIDPHYPEPRMKGRVAIERGFRWSLGSLDKPGFSIRNTASSGDISFFEVDTRHRLKIGLTVAFDQVFVVETREGRIRAYRLLNPIQRPASRGSSGARRALLGGFAGGSNRR
jgi:ketosteroid isomerase-like protein